MTCILKNQYKTELAELKEIVGSEDAAYYLLCANNGEPMNHTPRGEDSALYAALILYYGNPKDAILAKAKLYLPLFGNWVDDPTGSGIQLDQYGEPQALQYIDDLKDIDSDVITRSLEDNGRLNEKLHALAQGNIFTREFSIRDAIDISRSEFIDAYIADVKKQHAIDKVKETILRQEARLTYNKRTISKMIKIVRGKLVDAFGLVQKVDSKGKVYFESKDDTRQSKLRVEFVKRISDRIEGALSDEKGAYVDSIKDDLSIIYLSLTDANNLTFVHELAHRYINLFWDTQPVQDALKVMQRSKDKSAILTEERLANYLAKKLTEDDEESLNFAYKLKLAIKQMFSIFTAKSKREVLDGIVGYFAINQDISNLLADTIYFLKPDDPVRFASGYNIINDPDENLYKKLKIRAKSRVYALEHEYSKDFKAISEARELKMFIEAVDSKDLQQLTDMLSKVLDQAESEKLILETFIAPNLIENDASKIDIRRLIELRTNTLGYYTDILSAMSKYITINSPLYYKMTKLLQTYTTLADKINMMVSSWADYYIDVMSDELVDFAPNEQFKENAKKWVRNEINNGNFEGVYGSFEKTLGSAITSQSPILRIIDYLVRDSANKIRPVSLEKGNKLTNLLEKLRNHIAMAPTNIMNTMCETWKGKKTGNFIRSENFGGMLIAINEERQRVADKLGIELDENFQFLYTDVTVDQYNAFYSAMDDFYEQNDIIRPYKPEYYRIRRKFLSPETIERRLFIQDQINLLETKCKNLNTGIIEEFNLSSEDRQRLKDYRKQKQELSNPFIITKDLSGNIVSIKPKVGFELQMANELIAFNNAIRGKVSYVSDLNKFNQDYAIIKANYPAYQAQQFFEDNTIHKMVDVFDYYQLPLDIALLKALQRAIINAVKERPGYNMPNLSKLNDLAWDMLRNIDILISKWTELYGKFTGGQLKSWVRNIDSSYVNVKHYENGQLTATDEYDFIKSKYSSAAGLNVNAINNFYDKFHYLKYTGKNSAGLKSYQSVPLSAFSIMRASTIDVDGGYTMSAIIDEPTGRYTHLDKKSQLAEPLYDNNINQYLQPKPNAKWHNKLWDKHANDKKWLDLYNEFINTMGEIYQNLGMNDSNKYQLPGVRDDFFHSFYKKGWWNFGNWKEALTINETDIQYNNEVSVKPDGTVVRTIPIRWINKIKRPELTSTDLISTVTMMYEMSMHYKTKSEIAPIVLGLMIPMERAQLSEYYSKIDKYIDMYLYGRMRQGKVYKNKKSPSLDKAADTVMNYAHTKLMAHNWKVVVKNAIDSFWNMLKEIAGGKYFTVGDSIASDIYLFRDLFGHIFTGRCRPGAAKARTLTAAILQRSGVAGSVQEIFKGQRSSWLRRFLNKHFNMGEYTLVDYASKGKIALMTYHNHRLVLNPNTGAMEYMNKEKAQYVYKKAGRSEIEGLKAWRKAYHKNMLHAVYVDDNGNLKIKSDHLDYVKPINPRTGLRSNILETRLETIIRERSAVINGVLDEMDRSALQQNMFGAMALQMRGWMISLSIDNFKKGSDFEKLIGRLDDKENLEDYVTDPEYRNMLANISTGYVEGGAHRGLLRALARAISALVHLNKNKMTRQNRYQLRMLSISLISMIVTIAVSVIFGKWVEDDSDDLLSNWLYAVNTGAMSERVSQIPGGIGFSLLELVKSIFVATALWQDAPAVPAFLYDIYEYYMYQHGYINNPSYDDINVRGGYKGTTEMFEDFSKATSVIAPWLSINNIFKNFSLGAIKSSENFYNNQIPVRYINYQPQRSGTTKTNFVTNMFQDDNPWIEKPNNWFTDWFSFGDNPFVENPFTE